MTRKKGDGSRRASDLVQRNPPAEPKSIPAADGKAVLAMLRRLNCPPIEKSIADVRERVREVRETAGEVFGRLGVKNSLRQSGIRALHHFTDHTTEGHYAACMLRAAENVDALVERIEDANDALAAHALNQGAGMMVELFAWMFRYDYGPALNAGVRAEAALNSATNARKKAGDPVRDAARADIAANPRTTQGACARRVATAMNRGQRSVERLIEPLFEWCNLPGGVREKRPRQTDD